MQGLQVQAPGTEWGGFASSPLFAPCVYDRPWGGRWKAALRGRDTGIAAVTVAAGTITKAMAVFDRSVDDEVNGDCEFCDFFFLSGFFLPFFLLLIFFFSFCFCFYYG